MTENILHQKEALAVAVGLADGYGRNVAIVLPMYRGRMPGLIRDVLETTGADRVRLVHRTNGMEQVIFHGGGKIRFFAPAHRIRGYSCDTIVASADLDSKQMQDIIPAAATSPNRKVIRFHEDSNLT